MSTVHPRPNPVPSRGRIASAVAAEVDAVPGARRFSGAGVAIGTQHGGGQVDGVTVSATEVGVHIVAHRFPLEALGEAVRAAARRGLERCGDQRPVAVHIDDIELGDTPGPLQ